MNEIDKDLVRSVLSKLLLLKDGDPLKHGSGVCKELLEAVVEKNGVVITPHKYPESEYRWANSLANGWFVDTKGIMTPIRRDFIYKLLVILDNTDE